MRFNAYDYGIEYVMHCKNSEEALIFEEYLNSIEMRWSNGGRYAQNGTSWSPSGGGTCYRFRLGVRGDLHFYESNYSDIQILEFEDFEWGGENLSNDHKISYEEVMNFYNKKQ